MTSFAYYVQNFFSNIFACCGGGGVAQAKGEDGHLRASLNSSIRSNVLDYSFVAVPNKQSNSGDSNATGKTQNYQETS